jgi:hypothetical protein
MFTDQFVAELAAAVAKQVTAQMSETNVPKRLFTLPEAAVYLGRTIRAVEHLIARGAIQVTKLDGKRQIDKFVLDKLISDRTCYEL